MVELRTRKREMRGGGGNHDEEVGLRRISGASAFTIPIWQVGRKQRTFPSGGNGWGRVDALRQSH